MALRLLLILVLTSFSALADTETIVNDLTHFYPEVPLCTEEDPLQACAVELCGPPNQHQSTTLRDYNFERFLSTEGKAGLPAIKADLEKLLTKKVEENLKLIKDLKKKKENGTLLPKFDSFTERQWNDLATSIYQTHLGFNPYNPPEGPVKANAPVSEKVSKGLSDFAKSDGCTSAACREGLKDYLSEDLYGRKLEELMLKAANPNLVKDRLPYCLSAYAAGVLKKAQHGKIEAQLPQMYEKFIATALAGYSDHSKEVFRKYLKDGLDIKFEKPTRTTAEFLTEVKELSQPNKLNTTPMQQMMLYRDGKNGLDPLASLRSICPAGFYTAGGDLYSSLGWDEDSTKSGLFVSLASQLDPTSGEGVLYHELSHALSYVFSSGKMSKSSAEEFQKLRKCAKSLSPQDSPIKNEDERIHPGDHTCTEEDFADITSYKVFGNKSGPLSDCVLLKQSSDTTEYDKLDMLQKNGHSAKLVRILREAIHRDRKIPAVCQKVMDQNKDKFVFKKCF
jgi:hypothetical protein